MSTQDKHNIRANCVAPGLIETDFAKASWGITELLEKAAQFAALDRLVDTDEIAGTAVLLVSPAGNSCTGRTVPIDRARMGCFSRTD